MEIQLQLKWMFLTGNKLEGEVIKIIEHHSNIIVGKIDKKISLPFNSMMPFGSDIYIPPQKIKKC